ncbi:hypothetical protein GCM10020229_76070 [Kitasatospora albolonga]|uniref:DUF6296 family protein n=1 Tax=Kitasatospora albolonga TaxID=68173 RepID=UPI0031E78E39
MDVPTRYVITLPGRPGSHRPQEAVIVHATGEMSEWGRPVFAAGALRVDIADGIAHVLATATGPNGHTCLPATPLP